MNSKRYWEKRETEALKRYMTDEKEYDRRVKEIYQSQADAIQEQIDAFYGRYAAKEGISIAEAKKRVSKVDIAEYERKAAKYVAEKNFSDKANAEMRLYNATMRINRLELLKAKIGLELVAGHDELEKYMAGILKGRTIDELKRQAGILGETVRGNVKAVNAIVNASFHNATFSDRIWMYQDLLKNRLSGLLQSGLIQGKNPRELARELVREFGVSTSNAERLMRTELARVQTEAQKQSFEANGFTMYTFHANSGCCPHCQALDGQHFQVKDMMPGTNAAPLHPNCRCSVSAYEDSEEYEAWLDYLEKGGTTKEWNEAGKAIWKNRVSSLQNAETENEESKPKYEYVNTIVNMKTINSAEYRRRVDRISPNIEVNRSTWNAIKEILKHRSGTKYEDLAFVNSITGKMAINKDFNRENLAKMNKPLKDMLESAEAYTIIGIHNHPSSSVPSIADIAACVKRKYKFGIVACHDGKIYKYAQNENRYNESIVYLALAKLERHGYNEDVRKTFEEAGIDFEVLQ